jgi:ferrochelatase
MTKTGILLVNLGSPASPEPSDVRRYLDQFFMDERVLDYPRWLRRVVVSLFILPKRQYSSAEAYAAIWWPEGSPLIEISRRVMEAVQARVDAPVALGMRYGRPAIGAAVGELLAAGVERIRLLPLYPHYAMSSVETCVVEARAVIAKLAPEVELEVLPPFYADENYIAALVESARPDLQEYDHVLFSYHGLPERHLRKSDPTGAHCLQSAECCDVDSVAHATCYRHQVLTTTEAFVNSMGIDEADYSVSFQSRLGVERWLHPSTTATLAELAQRGVKRLVVLCPAFVADCLETLEEIGMRGREEFIAAGGEELTLVPCLNTQPLWIDALVAWVGEGGPPRQKCLLSPSARHPRSGA